MILSWTGARLEGGQYEKANVNATDNHHSTCLHYAAAAGMKSCVEVRESVWTTELPLGRALFPDGRSVRALCDWILQPVKSVDSIMPVLVSGASALCFLTVQLVLPPLFFVVLQLLN